MGQASATSAATAGTSSATTATVARLRAAANDASRRWRLRAGNTAVVTGMAMRATGRRKKVVPNWKATTPPATALACT